MSDQLSAPRDPGSYGSRRRTGLGVGALVLFGIACVAGGYSLARFGPTLPDIYPDKPRAGATSEVAPWAAEPPPVTVVSLLTDTVAANAAVLENRMLMAQSKASHFFKRIHPFCGWVSGVETFAIIPRRWVQANRYALVNRGKLLQMSRLPAQTPSVSGQKRGQGKKSLVRLQG